MKNIGLVCLLTKTKMKKGFTGINAFNNCKEPHDKLIESTLHNIKETLKCLEWVRDNNINMYRVSSALIPFYEFWEWYKNPIILSELTKASKYAKNHNIRLTIHPDQFTVLNSENIDVINNSLKILDYHNKLANILGINEIIIHIGRTKGDYRESFINTVSKLDSDIKSKLLLENCHKIKIAEIIDICKTTNIRPCLDVHHMRVANDITDFRKYVSDIRLLWKGKKPICHISSGKEFINDKSHNDFIIKDDVVRYKDLFDIFDVEIEAKKKEIAIIQLIKDFKSL